MALTIDQLNIQIAADSKNATRALTSLIKKLEQLKTALNGSAVSNITITNSFNKTTNAITKTTNATEKHNNTVKRTSKSTKSFTDNLAQQISKWRTLLGVFQSAARAMGSWFKESNDYIETLNLFNVTMGEGAEEARKYAESVSNLMGIDISEWMQYQGTFKQLTSGFGVASDAANVMSQNLTQLSYDMASFFNTDVETAFDKLSSAMSGQVKGLREFGIDTTVASLQEYALAKGIDTKVRSMTQAEKSLLRYNYIMEKSITIQGDMARTIVTPANALRILSAQFTQLKRALGNIISVIVARFIPYVQAMVQILTEAATAIAEFFNFKIPEIDYSGLGGNMTESFDDAEESAEGVSGSIKEIKKQLMGFDELNIISNPDADSGGGSGAGGSGGLGDMKPLEYNFLEGLDTSNLDEIKEKIYKILEIAKYVGIAIMGWKLGSFLADLALANTAMGGFAKFATSMGITIGATIAITGIAWFIDTSIEAWREGLGVPEMGELLASAGFTTVGAGLLGGSLGKAMGKSFGSSMKVGAGISLTVTGIGELVVGIKDLITNGPTLSNMLTILAGLISTVAGACLVLNGALGITWKTSLPIVGGIALIVTGLGAIAYGIIDLINNGPNLTNVLTILGGAFAVLVGVCLAFNTALLANPITWVIAGIMALIAAIVLCITYWEEIITWVGKAWDGVVAVWQVAANWFNDNVITPIVDFFRGLFETVAGFFVSLWEGIVAVWQVVAKWFYDYVISPVANFFVGLWNGISSGAVALWTGIKSVFSTVAKWFYDYVIKPVADFFVGLWDGFKNGGVAAWEGIKSVFSAVGTFFKDVFSAAWKGIVSVFSTAGEIFVNIKDGIVSVFKTLMNGFIEGLNWVIALPFKGLNGILETIHNISIVGAKPFSWLTWRAPVPQIPKLAEGGIVNEGQMFIAREAGPELVGSIGKKTAVANNDQIISGIESGVYRAMMAANSTNRGGAQTIRIINEIDGDVVGEKVIQYHNGRVIQTGESPLLI